MHRYEPSTPRVAFATREEPAISKDDLEPWAQRALAANGFGDAATADTALSTPPASYELHQTGGALRVSHSLPSVVECDAAQHCELFRTLRRVDVEIPPQRVPDGMRLVVPHPRLHDVILDPVLHHPPRRVREHELGHPVEEGNALR
jgi:hypothetical protein